MSVARHIVAALLCALPLVAQAVGLGNLNVRSALGQRLNAEIEVVALQPGEEETLAVRLGGTDSFKQAGVEFNPVLSTVRFAIERRGSKTIVRMTSTEPLNEPFLDLLIEIQWPSGRLVREYTFLLDPPGFGASPSIATPKPPAVVAPVVPLLPPKPPAAEAVAPVQETPAPAKEGQEATPAAGESATVAPKEEAAAAQPVIPAPVVEEKPIEQVAESPVQPAAPESKAEEARETKPAASIEEKQEAKPAASAEEKPAAKAEVAAAVESKPEPAAAAKRPAKGAERPRGFEVRKGDTLGEVAQWNLPQGVSWQQMLIALYRANPKAFLRENINLVRAGAILNIPQDEAVAAIDPKEAQRLVSEHIAAFADYRRSLSVAAAASAPVGETTGGQRSAEGKIDAVPGKPPASEPKDQVKLSKADTAQPGATQSRAAREDDSASRERALQDAQSRVHELEKNVTDLKTLLDLKNQQLAELEKKAKPAAAAAPVIPVPAKGPDAAKAAAAPVGQSPTTTPVPTPAAKAPEAPKPPVKGSEPTKAAPPAPDAKSVEGSATKPAPQPPAPAAKAATPEPSKTAPEAAAKAKSAPGKPAATRPEPGLFDELLDFDNPVTLGGLGAVALVLVGYGVFAVRRKRMGAKGQAAAAAGGAAGASSVFNPAAQAAGGSPSVIMPSVGQASVGGMGGDEVDPIAEADVYMAYGRDAQAEEILKEAIDKDPNRINVHEKLLEIYANRRDTTAFAQTMQKLQSLTGGAGPEWEKAMVLGRSIDPTNTSYGGAPSAMPDLQSGGGSSALDLDLDSGGTASRAAPDINLGAAEPGGGAASSIDFDLGMQTAATGGAAEKTDFTPEGTLIIDSTDARAASAGLDFDLGTTESTKSDDAGLNFELPAGFGAAAPTAEAIPAPAAQAEASGGLDFDLKMDIGGEAGAPASAAQEPMDLSSISLDLGVGGSPAAAGGDQKWQEVATKLDLAKAYQDMGDKDGARELLNEVLRDGDSAQQNQAQERLASLV